MISIVACCHSVKLCAHSAPGFPIATKWCCDQDVGVVPSSAFTQRTCDRCGSLWKRGDVVATSPVPLRWLCDSPRMGCAWRTTPYIYVAWTSNNRVIIACELYCCLLPQCEALRTCHSGFPIATILQTALFFFCQISSYVLKTNLWYRDLDKTSRPKLQISKFVHFPEIFPKIIITTLKLNFLNLFWLFLTYWYNREKRIELQKFYKTISLQHWQFQDKRLVTKTCNLSEQVRPETFKAETETRKNGLETKSQDFITANNPTK